MSELTSKLPTYSIITQSANSYALVFGVLVV